MDGSDFNDVKPALIAAVITMNIALNSVVIVVIAKYPQLREDRTALFIFSLTLSDLGSGCTAMPISAAVCSRATPQARENTHYLPIMHEFFINWFTTTSLYSLCCVSVCKMIAITRPFTYEQLLTRNRCYAIIGCIWLIGAVLAASLSHAVVGWDMNVCLYRIPVGAVDSSAFAFILFVGWIVPVGGVLYANSRIFCVIIRTHLQIRAQVSSISGTVDNNASMTLQMIRSGGNVLALCLALLVLTVPVIISSVASVKGSRSSLPYWYEFVAAWIYICNTFMNSFLYLILFRSVRQKAGKMFADLFEMCHGY